MYSPCKKCGWWCFGPFSAYLLLHRRDYLYWCYGVYNQCHTTAYSGIYHWLEVRYKDHLLYHNALFAMSTMQELFTLPDGSIMDIFQLDNRLLSAILGGILSGVGVSLSFSQGGSTGGVDIVAMIINKYRTISYGKIVRSIDSVIISSALLLPASADIGIDGVIYGFVMTAVLGYTVDMLMTGNQQSNQIMIVCQDYKAMADAMNNIAHRGATVLDAKGWYTKNQHNIVMVVCRKRDTSYILKIAQSVDPNAFITVGSVMGVYGRGFDALNKI